MSHQNNSDMLMFIFIAIAIGIGMLTWKVSDIFNLDWETGCKVVMGLLITVTLAIVSIYTGFFSIAYPILLGLFWFVCWPALDYWATGGTNSFDFLLDRKTPWWAAWYIKAGVLIGLIGIPYLIKKIRSPYY